MTRQYRIYWLFPLCATIALHCSTQRNIVDQGCREIVRAESRSLPGCDMLLITKENEIFLPANPDKYPIKLSDGAHYLVDYEIMEGAVSMCMAEDAIVRLHCLEALSVDALRSILPTHCKSMTDPFDPAWSEALMLELDPVKVEEMTFGDALIYQFHTRSGKALYDCHGQEIASFRADAGVYDRIVEACSRIAVKWILNE